MKEYTVAWTIQESADSEWEAAQSVRARYFQLTEATVFEVAPVGDELGCRVQELDLTYPDQNRVLHKHTPQVLHKMAERIKAEGGDADAILDMLARPGEYADLLTQVLLDEEFDKVSPVPDTPDLTPDPVVREPRECRYCGTDILPDDRGAMATGYWYATKSLSAVCHASSMGYHDPIEMAS